ncbi:hypothetical protein [uncultured Alistipes sp.]|uniref:hypothetical protein n=1 Tax=uncultured Alistipes sp. TaxID=538949 RepID=UPI0026196345|nr:hypothetical protein [uncultured Alistipes sp.]
MAALRRCCWAGSPRVRGSDPLCCLLEGATCVAGTLCYDTLWLVADDPDLRRAARDEEARCWRIFTD